MSKSVLLTNFSLKDYTGSEIDTVEISNYFMKKGYDVSIFTIDFQEPLKNEVNKDITVYTFADIDNLPKKFDIIWAHHFPLLDYLLFTKKIKADYINYLSLSSYEPLEFLPQYYKDLSNICFLNEESVKNYREKLNIDTYSLFPNYYNEEFYDFSKRNIDSLNNVCVISNHVPQEVIDCSEILKKNGINVDIYGINHTFVRITPELLSKYDLVISIGKSVIYALCMNIPCLVYDRFGGDLFLNEKTIDKSYACNFSGRAYEKKFTGEELYNYIVNNFPDSLNSLENNYKFVEEHCYLDKNIEVVLEKTLKKKIDYEKLYQENEYLTYVSEVYVRDVFFSKLNNNINLIKNKELTNKVNELEKRNNDLLNSTSWKITKPVRFIGNIVNKISKNKKEGII